MATGERTYSTQGRTPAKFEFKPIAPGEYELKLNSDWTQRVAEGEGKIPYVTGSFTAIGSGNGGKDRRVFHRMMLGLAPGKDGVANADRANSILGLAKALGTEFSAPVVTMNGKELLSPKHVLQWIQSNDGAVLRGDVKIEKGSGGYEDKNVINFFVESEEQAAPIQEENETIELNEATEDVGGFAAETEVVEEEEFEAVPPPKLKSVRPAPAPTRVVQGPAKRTASAKR